MLHFLFLISYSILKKFVSSSVPIAIGITHFLCVKFVSRIKFKTSTRMFSIQFSMENHSN